MVNDVGKMVLLGIALIGGLLFATVGLIRNVPEAYATGFGLIGTVVGYLCGNGVNAARGEAPSPVFVPTPERIESKRLEDER